jgi:hypothetical protein
MKLAQHARSLLAAALLLSALPSAASPQRRRPARRPAAAGRARVPARGDVERRVESLLARMTLEEKLGQLQQSGGDVAGKAEPRLFEEARAGRLGSTLGVRGARNANELQRAAVEGTRLKIPLIFGFDVIHGYRTIFPIPLGEAASWDPAAAERSAYVAAAEARAAGLHWTFAPMVDATPAGGASQRARARTPSSARPSRARACGASRAPTTPRRTASSPAPSTSSPTGRPRAGATTTRPT